MTPIPKRADSLPSATDAADTLELSSADVVHDVGPQEEEWLQPTETPVREQGAGGRQVLGTALAVLAALWIGYAAWSAGRMLGGQPLSSPLLAQ